MAPEAPIRAPAVIRRLFEIKNPLAAVVQPEYEFSIETTTGMSAPPIA
eukprot:CAMPEP_0168317304 /NCGR_PEP_ID=MMETSP0210-20121227/23765_1 /TAXON_ID=40633 /ORGANISM="Condylostoma magnum, Strain COL2" /LENGTH=47 /DNA_ID= /DNA_START= /DNA_END= /DNA_ORIENTATION=